MENESILFDMHIYIISFRISYLECIKGFNYKNQQAENRKLSKLKVIIGLEYESLMEFSVIGNFLLSHFVNTPLKLWLNYFYERRFWIWNWFIFLFYYSLVIYKMLIKSEDIRNSMNKMIIDFYFYKFSSQYTLSLL